MRILVLGGSGFAGRVAAEEAATRGHDVTVFNRGHRDGPLGVTTLTGDRDYRGGLTALHHGEWDAVLDTWSGEAEAVDRAVALLRHRVGHFVYVSSRSVYARGFRGRLDEEAPTVPAGERGYPGDKLRGEIAALDFPGPVLLARAGLILGPHEDTGRLCWWLQRLARGGPTLAPGPRDLPLQYVDVRDLAAFLIDAVEQRRTGIYDVTGPSGHATMGSLLQTATAVTGGRAGLCWVAPDEILAAGITPWTQLPIWVPPGDDHHLIHEGSPAKALDAGLRTRPVRETVADTWTWLRALRILPREPRGRQTVGLDTDVEHALLLRRRGRSLVTA